MENCSVFRDREGLTEALEKIRQLKNRYENIGVSYRGRTFNFELEKAFELGNMLKTADVIVLSALQREESRGAHYRNNFPQRNDESWLKHTLVSRTAQGLETHYKPVTITSFKPKARTY